MGKLTKLDELKDNDVCPLIGKCENVEPRCDDFAHDYTSCIFYLRYLKSNHQSKRHQSIIEKY